MEKIKPVLEWMKRNKWKVIVPVLLIAVLAFAFWYGGDTPGARGWTIEENTSTEAITTEEAVSEESTAKEDTTEESTTEAEDEAESESECESERETESEATALKPTQPQTAETPKPTLAQTTEALTQPVPPVTEAPAKPEQPVTEAPTEAPTQPTPPPTEPPAPPTEAPKSTCTISISCSTILNNMDRCDESKKALIPGDGWILRATTVEFTPGESVFDVLLRVCQTNGIHMESEWTPMYNSAYIEGIYNIYEFDVGSDSGWMYKVNGWFPNYGCSRYTVENGDEICWVYTCNLGDDVGGGNMLN